MKYIMQKVKLLLAGCFTTGLLTLMLLLVTHTSVMSTHIVGGGLRYNCLGNDQYEIILTVRRDCEFGAQDAPFDDPASIGVFDLNGNLIQTVGDNGEILLAFRGDETLNNEIQQVCFSNSGSICVHITEYRDTVSLPVIFGGYELAYQRCCRNASLTNVVDPLNTGMTLSVGITERALTLCNNSPEFNVRPDIFICATEALNFDGSAIDADGDVLVYKLCTPFAGASDPNPQPQPPAAPPYQEVEWVNGFSLEDLLGGEPITIDQTSAQLIGVPGFIGQYLIGLCVEEYRDGELLSEIRREFQYNVVSCNNEIVGDFDVVQDGCSLSNVQFVNNSSSANQYRWYFDYPSDDPAFISTEESPVFDYPGPGHYTVRLFATNPETQCQAIVEKNVTISDGQSEAFNTTILSCAGMDYTIRLSDDSQINNAERVWTVLVDGREVSGTSQNIEFIANSSSVVDARLEILSETGCTEVQERRVNLNLDDAVDYNIDFEQCLNNEEVRIRLIDNSTGLSGISPTAVSWLITRPNGQSFTSTGSEYIATLPINEALTLVQEVTFSNGCIIQEESNLDLDLDNYASFETDFLSCDPQNRNSATVAFRSLGNELPGGHQAISYEWLAMNGNEDFSFTGPEFVMDFDFFSPVWIGLTVQYSNGCSAYVERNVSLNELLDADLDITTAFENCEGEDVSVTFSNNASLLTDGLSITQKNWRVVSGDFEDSAIGNSISYSGKRGEQLQVSFSFVMSNGCAFDQLLDVSLDPSSIAFDIDAFGNDGIGRIFICDGDSREIVSNPNPDWIYEWSTTEGLTFDGEDRSNPIASPLTTTTYMVTVTNDECSSVGTVIVVPSSEVELTILPNNTTGRGDNQSISFCDNNISLIVSGASNYEWSMDPGFTNIISRTSVLELQQEATTQRYYVRAILEGCVSEAVFTDVTIISEEVNNFRYDILSCDGNNVNVRLYDLTGNPNSSWIININGTELMRSGSPLDLSLFKNDEVFARLDAESFDECMSTEGMKIITDVTDLIDYDIDVLACPNGEVQLKFNNLSSDTLGLTVQQIDWVFQTSTGAVSSASGAMTTQTFPEGDIISLMLGVAFSNGCQGTLVQELDLNFGNYLDYDADLVSCNAPNQFTVDLSINNDNLPLNTQNASYSWEIINGTEIITGEGQGIRAEVNLDETVIINQTITLANGCSYTGSQELTHDDIFGDGIDNDGDGNGGDNQGDNNPNDGNGGIDLSENNDVEINVTPISCGEDEITVSVNNRTTFVLDGDASVVSKDWMIMGAGAPGQDPVQVNTCAESNQVSILGASINATNSQNVCVPFNAYNFTEVTSIQTGFRWDPTVLRYESIKAGALPNIDVNENFVDDGDLRFVWLIDLGTPFITANNNATLFEICFDVIGQNGESSNIEMTDINGLRIEVTTQDDGVVEPCLQTASVNISDNQSDGTMINATGDEVIYTGQPGEEIDVKLTMTLSNGCVLILRDRFTLNGPDIIFFDDFPGIGPNGIDDNRIVVCPGEPRPLIANPNPAWTYEWSPIEGLRFDGNDRSNPLALPSMTTTYMVTVTDGGCSTTGSIIVEPIMEFDLMIILDGQAGQMISCSDSASLSTSSNMQGDIQWSLNPDFDPILATSETLNVVHGDSSQTYYARQIINENCMSETESITVTMARIDVDGLNVDTNVLTFCDSTQTTISAQSNLGNDNIQWFDANTNEPLGMGTPIDINPSLNPVIYATAMQLDGCTYRTDDIALEEYDINNDVDISIGGDNGGIPEVFCAGDDTQIFVTPLSTDSLIYEWGPAECIVSGANTTMPIINATEDKELILRVMNLTSGCSNEVVIPVSVSMPDVTLFADPSEEIYLGTEVEILTQTEAIDPTFDWSTGDMGSTITVEPTDSTDYVVTVTDAFGCMVVDTMTITVKTDCSETGIFLPSGFTPNNDGVNDIWMVRTNSVRTLELSVFDRWGRQVFGSTNVDEGWNGSWDNTGDELPSDAYGYWLRTTCFNGEEYMTQGNVSLIR